MKIRMTLFTDSKYTDYLRYQYAPLTVRQYIAIINEYLHSGMTTQDYTQSLFRHVSKYRQWMACLRNYSRYMRFKKKMKIAQEINEMIESFKIRIKSERKIKVKTLPEGDRLLLIKRMKEVIASGEYDYQFKIPYMITAFCLLNGLRISEAINIKRRDIKKDKDSFHLTVIGKGSKERTMVMDSLLVDLYKSFINDVPYKQDSIFATIKDQKPLLRQDAVNYLKRLFKREQITWMSPHKLRHTFATMAVFADVPLPTIQTILGHENLATTSLYEHANIENQKQAMEKIKKNREKIKGV